MPTLRRRPVDEIDRELTIVTSRRARTRTELARIDSAAAATPTGAAKIDGLTAGIAKDTARIDELLTERAPSAVPPVPDTPAGLDQAHPPT